jgi:xylulokinase
LANSGYLLGLDVGTSAVKGVLVGIDGQVIARAETEHGVSQPHPGWVEQDAERQWWGDGLDTIRALLAKAQVPPSTIAAVGICGLVPCLLPLDGQGRPLRPAILYADQRALAELAWVNDRLGSELTAQAIVPKLLWLKNNEPDLFARTRAVVSAHTYVVYRLTGRLAVDYDTASIYGAIFDRETQDWRAEACQALGIPSRLLPPPCAATKVVGQVTDSAAQQTGLAAGTPVIAGTGDTFPAIVGAGAVSPGTALITFGTTGLVLLIERPLEEVVNTVHFGPGAAGRPQAIRWIANVLTCGRALQWFWDEFWGTAAQEPGHFVALDEQAAQIAPGSQGLIALPHFLGRRTPTPDPFLRGAFIGLTLSHTREHLYRALLESFGYAARQGLDPLRSQVEAVIVTAGGAKSRLWRQIVSDILDSELEYAPQSSGSLGIAYLAGLGTRVLADFRLLCSEWLGQRERTVPRPENRLVYDRLFALVLRAG